MYGKLSLDTLVEKVSGNLLILDPDTIVHCDVTQLGMSAMADLVLGVVYKQRHTFNSGVMLANLAKWKEHGVEKALLASWLDDPDAKNPDQDLLNRVVRPEWILRLDSRWNILAHTWQPGMKGIIHCVGGRKPWHGDYRRNRDVQRLFFTHLDRTFLAGRREWAVTGSLKRRLNKWRILRERVA